jgi:hypothetical protein
MNSTETLLLTPEQVKAAREWCHCCWGDEAEAIDEATDLQIQRVIAKRWDGGLADFVECNPAPMADAGIFGDY